MAKRPCSRFLASALLIFCTFGSGWAVSNPPVDATPFDLIEQDFETGKIDVDRRAMLLLTSVKDPFSLPSTYQYKSLAAQQADLRAATLALIEIRQTWEQLSDKTQRAISEALARVVTDSTFISASDFFMIHYDLVGVDAVPSADLDFSGFPDYVEKAAAYLDSSLQKHIELGFLLPPSDGGFGGDNRFDVYFENMGYYGYAVPEGAGSNPWNDAYSYLVLHNTFVGFPPNTDPEGPVAGAAKATVAHEFHHCVQFAYDYNEGSWFMELDATCMEDIVFDQVNDNYNYLDDFMNSPQTSLMDNSGHKYASFIWGIFLAEKFDTALLVDLWEGARYKAVYDALSDSLLGNYGWTQDSAIAEFTAWNFITATRNDNFHYLEGGDYLPVAIGRTHSNYPVVVQNSPSSPSGYASCYIRFYPGISQGVLKLTFNGADSRQWKAVVVKSLAENQHEVETISLNPFTYYGEILVPDFESYQSVTLIGVNVSEFNTGALFTYSASVLIPYSVSSKVLSVDSAVYSGSSRQFTYQVTNSSSFNDVFNAIAWDSQGWLPADTIDRAIAAGDSSVFEFNVNPPQGTPLDLVSDLQFKAVSWGDSSVVDSQTFVAKTFLQRGDADFTGAIDIADVLYVVEYMFASGPTPLPIDLSADFDCTGGVDIADLLALVEYSFASGPYPLCNPY